MTKFEEHLDDLLAPISEMEESEPWTKQAMDAVRRHQEKKASSKPKPPESQPRAPSRSAQGPSYIPRASARPRRYGELPGAGWTK
jgi:hypothetical protein